VTTKNPFTQPEWKLYDGYGRYRLPAGKGVKTYQRVTTFAGILGDKYALGKWQTRKAVYGMAVRPDLAIQAAAAGPDDRDTLDAIAEKASEHAGSKAGADWGTAFHTLTEYVDRGEEPPSGVPAEFQADLDAYREMTQHAGLVFRTEWIERVVRNKAYEVAGKLDRITEIGRPLRCEIVNQSGKGPDSLIILEPGDRVIGDVKTTGNIEYAIHEIAVQLCAYADADAMFNTTTREFEDMPERIRKDVALVFWVPKGTGTATLVAVDIAAGREAIKHAMWTRDWRKRKDLSGSVVVDDSDYRVVEMDTNHDPNVAISGDRAVLVDEMAEDAHDSFPWLRAIEECQDRDDLRQVKAAYPELATDDTFKAAVVARLREL
jgi:hypothetical protein